MRQTFKELGYPVKLYLYIALFAASVIGMRYVVDTQLPGGGRPPYLFLIWNTFLAWIPLALAIALDLISLIPSRPARWGLMLPAGLIWLFFYPNAAYLITDMLHPFNRYPIPETGKFWIDMSFWDHLFTLFFVALLGLALASVSLASVHQLVRKAWGAAAGWMFAIAVLLLSSFGIYLGRFIRWNSWDLLKSPMYVVRETADYFADPGNVSHALAFCKWIFIITLFCYVVLYGAGAMRKRVGEL